MCILPFHFANNTFSPRLDSNDSCQSHRRCEDLSQQGWEFLDSDSDSENFLVLNRKHASATKAANSDTRLVILWVTNIHSPLAPSSAHSGYTYNTHTCTHTHARTHIIVRPGSHSHSFFLNLPIVVLNCFFFSFCQ